MDIQRPGLVIIVSWCPVRFEEGVQKGVFRKVDPQITGNLIAYNMFFYPLRGWYFRGKVELESIEGQIVDFIMNGLIK